MKIASTASIGLLGGSFDPPHLGHINLAICLMEAHGLAEVWFCPAWTNPFKEGNAITAVDHRLRMTELAIEGIPQFHLLDFESRQNKLSFTIDTVRYLTHLEQSRPKPRKLHVLLGADAALSLPRWRDAEAIIELAPPLVGLRPGYVFDSDLPPLFRQALEQGRTDIPQMDISSTAIRRRLMDHLYCGHLLPAKVMDYISHNDLY